MGHILIPAVKSCIIIGPSGKIVNTFSLSIRQFEQIFYIISDDTKQIVGIYRLSVNVWRVFIPSNLSWDMSNKREDLKDCSFSKFFPQLQKLKTLSVNQIAFRKLWDLLMLIRSLHGWCEKSRRKPVLYININYL